MSAGLENDYMAWRRAFWKSVENGLKRDQTSAKKHKACTSSADGKCCCKTDKEHRGLSEVLLALDFRLYICVIL